MIRWPFVSLLLLAVLAACGDTQQPARSPRASAPTADAAFGVAARGDGDADLNELRRYKLRMDKVQKLYAANRNLVLAAAKHPGRDMDISGDDDQTLDQMADRIEENPLVRQAIEDAGLSSREYARIALALFQAAFTAGMIEQQGGNVDSLAAKAGVNSANIAFLREHRAEIERMTREMESFRRAHLPADEDEEGDEEEPGSEEPR